jgi:nicotinic acid phosphoribosyltransferase
MSCWATSAVKFDFSTRRARSLVIAANDRYALTIQTLFQIAKALGVSHIALVIPDDQDR